VSVCRNAFETFTGCRDRGKKTWEECIKLDLKSCGLMKEAAMDGNAWRGLIVGNVWNRPTNASMEKGRYIDDPANLET